MLCDTWAGHTLKLELQAKSIALFKNCELKDAQDELQQLHPDVSHDIPEELTELTAMPEASEAKARLWALGFDRFYHLGPVRGCNGSRS